MEYLSSVQCSPLSKICCMTAGPLARNICRPSQKVAGPAKNSKDMLIADVIYIVQPTKFSKLMPTLNKLHIHTATHVYKYSIYSLGRPWWAYRISRPKCQLAPEIWGQLAPFSVSLLITTCPKLCIKKTKTLWYFVHFLIYTNFQCL